jgi:hypothetical protein
MIKGLFYLHARREKPCDHYLHVEKRHDELKREWMESGIALKDFLEPITKEEPDKDR